MLEPWAWRHKCWKKLPYYYLFEREHLRHAAVALATSDQEAANLSRFIPRERISTIELGLSNEQRPDLVAARKRLGWDPDELVLLFLSRVHRKKGLHLLLLALGGIAASLPKTWRLVIVGDGEEKYISECRSCAEANENVLRHTEWKGAVWGEEKWNYYQAADLFCLPSFSENFGLAILEACQVGTRILTTRYTPWGYLERSGAAFLAEPEVASVERGLRAFLKAAPWSQADRQALSNQIYDRFGWQTVGQRYLQMYRELISPSIAQAGRA